MESKRCFFFVAHMSTEPQFFRSISTQISWLWAAVAFAAGAAEIFKQQDASGRHEALTQRCKGIHDWLGMLTDFCKGCYPLKLQLYVLSSRAQRSLHDIINLFQVDSKLHSMMPWSTHQPKWCYTTKHFLHAQLNPDFVGWGTLQTQPGPYDQLETTGQLHHSTKVHITNFNQYILGIFFHDQPAGCSP